MKREDSRKKRTDRVKIRKALFVSSDVESKKKVSFF